MTDHEPHVPKTPPHRRLIRTDVPGVYHRGERYVAVTQLRGRKVKSSHRTKAEAKFARAERQAGKRPASWEPFDAYAELWLVEYSGRTSRGLTRRRMRPTRRSCAVG